MAVYQVFSDDFMGLTTDLKQAEEFLEQIHDEDNGSSIGIYLMKINEKTGKFEVDDFALEGQSLRKITKREMKRLPDKLYVLNMNGEEEIEHISYDTEKSLLKDLRYYHEYYGEIFSTFGDYCDNFAAYILFEAIIEDPDPADITFEGIVNYVKDGDDYIGTAKIGELTSLDTKNMGEIYLPRIDEKNLRKAYDLAQAYAKIMR
uniref:Uncharacterized protein n=1 Tax=Pithovirus LCPAC403 TaxID=2506596 RepID=A0A481ZEA9_9VIRU|nr:MAG: hypothetical protein LCPAC403_01050 [Pithovirus LCPAC403]